MIAINKADGDNVTRAERAAAEYRAALQILTPQSATWAPPVVTISGRENKGLDVALGQGHRAPAEDARPRASSSCAASARRSNGCARC